MILENLAMDSGPGIILKDIQMITKYILKLKDFHSMFYLGRL